MGSKKELSECERAIIASDHKDGLSYRQIASNIYFFRAIFYYFI